MKIYLVVAALACVQVPWLVLASVLVFSPAQLNSQHLIPSLQLILFEHSDSKYTASQGTVLASSAALAIPATRQCGQRAQARKRMHTLHNAPVL